MLSRHIIVKRLTDADSHLQLQNKRQSWLIIERDTTVIKSFDIFNFPTSNKEITFVTPSCKTTEILFGRNITWKITIFIFELFNHLLVLLLIYSTVTMG